MFCVDVPGGLHNILSAVCILALHVRVIFKFVFEVPFDVASVWRILQMLSLEFISACFMWTETKAEQKKTKNK